MYAINCFQASPDAVNDWAQTKDADGYWMVLVYVSKRAAQKKAAEFFGFDTYTEVKRHGWCEVREYTPRPREIARIQY